jgi:hypothetical protein
MSFHKKNKVTDFKEVRRDNSALDYVLELRSMCAGSTKYHLCMNYNGHFSLNWLHATDSTQELGKKSQREKFNIYGNPSLAMFSQNPSSDSYPDTVQSDLHICVLFP